MRMFQRLKFYLQESYSELKRVNWPSRQETVNMTLMVVGLSLGLAIFLGAWDAVFHYLLGNFLL